MKGEELFHITREKHLDHMVKVVPFILCFYSIQCFVILQIGVGGISSSGLSIMGVLLALMVTMLVTYDLKQKAWLEEERICLELFGFRKVIHYKDIQSILINDPGQSFSSLEILMTKGRVTLYFVDDAEKIKKWIEDKKSPMAKAAA